MDDKNLEMNSLGVVELPSRSNEEAPSNESKGNTNRDDQEMAYYGKRQQLKVRLQIIAH